MSEPGARPRPRSGPRRAIAAALALLAATLAMPSAWASFTSATASVSGTFGSATLTAASGLGAVCTPATDYVVLAWTPSLALATSGYEVLRSGSSGGPFSAIGSVSGLLTVTYTDTITAGTTYYYEVEPTRDDWTGPASNVVSVHSIALGVCTIS
jgi:hypothetical protein